MYMYDRSSDDTKGLLHVAVSSGDKISIDWVSDGDNSTSIHWVGTFAAPTNAAEPYTWTSQRDTEGTK